MDYKKAAEFLRSIKEKEGVVIVYNNDMDGMSAGAMMKKYLEKRGIKPYKIYQPMPPEKNFLRRVQTSLPDVIIFVDMAMDSDPNTINKLKGYSRMLIIDHHMIARDLNSTNIVHVNPRFKDPKVYQSTAYLVYKLLSYMEEDPDVWIAILGAIGDYNLEYSQDLVKKAQEYDSMKKYREACHAIEASRIAKTFNCDEIVDFLTTVKSIDDILEDRRFAEAAMLIENEIQSEISNANENVETFGNLLMYNCKSKYNIRSVISTKIAEKHKTKVVIVYGEQGKSVIGSMRNQGRTINTVDVLKKAAAGVKGFTGGGHDAASGFSVPEKDWKNFKENLAKVVAEYQK